MFKLILAALAVAIFCGSAQAQSTLTSFEVDNVLAAAQCELGIFARRTNYHAPLPGRDKALIVVEGKEIVISEYRGGLPIIGGGYTQTITKRWKRTAPRNIHRDNEQACARSRPPVGLVECLTTQRRGLFSPTDGAECETTVSALKDLTVGGSFVWIVTVQLSAKESVQREYSVTLTAPPPR
ncbi:hypothetical protein [Tardiphaga sp. 803_E3_N1_3]|uniref:hypothetical protein n=1 Tax=unclassified Tardiphaga TaxID=2631404 RepID=UPI003F25CFDF